AAKELERFVCVARNDVLPQQVLEVLGDRRPQSVYNTTGGKRSTALDETQDMLQNFGGELQKSRPEGLHRLDLSVLSTLLALRELRDLSGLEKQRPRVEELHRSIINFANPAHGNGGAST
ncbi:hypothetical protein HK102_005050, partial [Quaeritorhiza haematococci]